MEGSTENKYKYQALGFTLFIHVLLFLLFIFTVFITPIPPFEIKPVPEIEIGLGMEGLGSKDAGGSGNKDKELTTANPEPVKITSTPVVQSQAAEVLTDDTETEAVIKTSSKKPKKTPKVEIEAPKVVEEKPSSELSNALAILKSKKKHSGNGEGTNNSGGSGNGTEQGVGNGSGTGHGKGQAGGGGAGGYDLKGRSILRRPARMTDSREEGIVVVEIIVDETGKVVKATPGQRGSTTTSANLYAKARQAAYEARFNPSPEGTKEQRGTYTFVFTLE
jgi:periplasmic protein TonB